MAGHAEGFVVGFPFPHQGGLLHGALCLGNPTLVAPAELLKDNVVWMPGEYRFHDFQAGIRLRTQERKGTLDNHLWVRVLDALQHVGGQAGFALERGLLADADGSAAHARVGILHRGLEQVGIECSQALE